MENSVAPLAQLGLVHTGFAQQTRVGGEPLYVRVQNEEHAAEGNTVLLKLDCGVASPLRWEEPLERARGWVQQGYHIVWELELGLSVEVLEDTCQVLALTVAAEHFSKTVWPQFSTHSLGALLYRGALDFTQFFAHTQAPGCPLICRQQVLDVLRAVAAHLPEEIPCFLWLVATGIPTAAQFFRLAEPAYFFPFHLILEGEWGARYPYALPVWSAAACWSPLGCFGGRGQEEAPPSLRIENALLLPQQEEGWPHVAGALDLLPPPFRVLSEVNLTQDWEGVDTLYVLPEGVSLQGERKLLGFQAAGGLIQR